MGGGGGGTMVVCLFFSPMFMRVYDEGAFRYLECGAVV